MKSSIKLSIYQKRNVLGYSKKVLESTKNSLSRSQVKEIIIESVTNSIGMCCFNFTNDKLHHNNSKAASIIFGFSLFNKTKNYISVFFHYYEMDTPIIKLINNKMHIKPGKFTTFE